MSELIVQVTPQGEIIGPINRDVAHDQFLLHAVVFAFLLTPEDPSSPIDGGWFIKRSENVQAYPGYISVPAGHVEYKPDQSLFELGEENIYREILEEIGLNDRQAPVQLVQTAPFKTDTEQQLLLIYKGRVGYDLPVKRQVSEVKEIRYLTLSKVQELIEIGKVSPFAIQAMKLIGLIT